MKKFYSLSICLALFFSVLIVGNLEAATYYIDGSNGNDSNSGTIASPWKTIGKANSTLKGGDTVYLRAGTYTSQQIKPSNSGKSGNYITYQNYEAESVTLSRHSVPLYLYGNDYVKIDGIRFQNSVMSFALLGGADYNIIQNCSFYRATSYFGSMLAGHYIDPNSGVRDKSNWIGILNKYNQLLDNIWENAPDGCADGPDQDCDTYPADNIMIQCGAYNLIQGNTFGNTSHNGLTIVGSANKNNVIRANLFQNTYRRGFDQDGVYQSLIENNMFYDHGANQADNPAKYSRTRRSWAQPATQNIGGCENHIFRKNIFDNNGTSFYMDGKHNYFYHNTANEQIVTVYGEGFEDYKYNKLKNNIFANTQSLGRSGDTNYLANWYTYLQKGYVASDNVITHNSFTGTDTKCRWKYTVSSFEEWENLTSEIYDNLWEIDPNFIDMNNRNFGLQQSSPMIDAGDWLTVITSSTANGISSFTVGDAGYFYDGWSIPDETGDVIKTEKGQITTISSINYDTNTITVSPPINIVNGEGLALNHAGSAPDIGAHEYEGAIVPPALLRLLSGN